MTEYKSDTVAQQAPTQPKFAPSDILGVFAIIADVLVTIVIVVGMAQDKHSVTVSVLSGVAFFFSFGMFVLLILSGTLKEIVTNGQNQRTIRHRDVLPYAYAERTQKAAIGAQVVPPMQIGYTPAVEAPRLLETPSFIPAVPRPSETVKIDAANFINHLFDGDGRPLPSKITRNKGQIQHKSPSPEAIEYMASLGIVRPGEGNQLYFDATTYPTHRDALNSVRTGVRPSLWQGGKEKQGEGVTYE